MSRSMIAVTLALLAGAVAQAQTPAPAKPVVPAIVMEDQFGRTHHVAEHRGDIFVLIYGDRASAAANKALGERAHIAFHPSAQGQPPAQARRAPVRPVPGQPADARTPDVLAVPVACVGNVPGLVRKIIRGQVRSASPDVPVWLDFGDVLKKGFGLKAGVPNVVVLDAAGRFRYSAAGPFTPEAVERLLGTIEALRREAVRR
jgi:hypothetical protein